MNQLLSPLHAPLGLPLLAEVHVEHVDVACSDVERRSFAPVKISDSEFFRQSLPSVPEGLPFDEAQDGRELGRFRPEDEVMKLVLCRSLAGLAEPVECMIEAIASAHEPGAEERLLYTPSILDFYPDELRIQERRGVAADHPARENLYTDLGSDSHYTATVAANLEAEPEAPSAGLPDATPVPKPAAESVLVAHSPCAYDLSGCVPWANYTLNGFGPLSPTDIRFHRVHVCSPNTDRADTVWSVFGAKAALGLEVPPDGSCPFRTSGQLSLRDKTRFLLVESVEQFPLLMHFHGMSGSLLRFWRPKDSHGPDMDQLEELGTLGQLVRLSSEFLPRAFGGNTVKVESACTVLESSLVRQPLFPHHPRQTDFLLVRSKTNKGAAAFHCVLRQIESLFVAGQAEPLYRVDVPVVPRLHQVLSTRVGLEARRFWLRVKSQPSMEFINHFFLGERRSLLSRYFADAIRDLQQRPTAAFVSPISPEEACVVNAMREGVRRLAERGIERIAAISPMRIRNYVRDIEVFERSMPLESPTPRIAHLAGQLENEMRVSTWNLSNDYWDVLTGKRGAMFQFSPLGDPSGGRGEGISYRKILKVEGVSAAGALGSISGARKGGPAMDDIRSKGKKELVAELQKLNVPESLWRAMSRWQLMRQLSVLLGIEDDTEERLAPYKRKALHTERIAAAWRKQGRALADPNPPKLEEAGGDSHKRDIDTESDDDDEEGVCRLEADLLADLKGGSAAILHDDEQTELEEFRKNLNGEEEMIPESGGQEAPDNSVKITRLQIVATGRVKSTGNPWSRVTYVYGKRNIALYRKWKELEEEGAPQPAPDVQESPAVGWHGKVEMSLKVHRRFQRILKQAAEAGQPIPDIKRCGACHLFGHDSSYEGCPMLVREMDQTVQQPVASAKTKKRPVEQSPIYD